MARTCGSSYSIWTTAMRCLFAIFIGAALLGEACSQPAASRDWVKHPAIVELESTADIYALGDIHGDYERMVQLLAGAKLIAGEPDKPEKIQWSAGKAVLVINGDMINKGDQSYAVLIALRAIRESAATAGGRVVVCMGNHEADFLAQGGSGAKRAEFIQELLSRNMKPEEVAAGTDAEGLGAFLRNLPFAVRVNDWFFAHAGNTQGQTLRQLDLDLQKGVNARGFTAEVLQGSTSILQARLHPLPWFERANEPADSRARRLGEYAAALGVRHIVVGHQPGKLTFSGQPVRHAGELAQRFDGLLFLIDVGMSRAVGNSTGALLHIAPGTHDRAWAIDRNGQEKEIWSRGN